MTKVRQIETGNYYHIYSRGVDKTLIFRDHSDYISFQNMIKKFNTDKKVRKRTRSVRDNNNTDKKVRKRTRSVRDNKLVDIFCFTLMPNHFHFILKELVEGGVSLFLKKILGQHANYFNDKYKRTGSLFGTRFKDKLIDSDQYFEHLVGYIWNNPIKLINQKYKSIDLFNGIIELKKSEKDFALYYPYKDFPNNYIGPNHKKNTKTKFDIFDF